MTTDQAKRRLGDNRTEWELKNMIKALTSFALFNTPEQDQDLAAAKVLLKHKKTKR